MATIYYFSCLDGLTTWSILLVFSGIIQDTVVIWQLTYGGWITNNLTHLSGAWKWDFWNGKRLAGFLFCLSFLSSSRSYFTASLSSSKRLTSQGSLSHLCYVLFIKTSHKAIPNSRGGEIGSNFDKKGKVILQRGMVGIITATLQICHHLWQIAFGHSNVHPSHLQNILSLSNLPSSITSYPIMTLGSTLSLMFWIRSECRREHSGTVPHHGPSWSR